MTMRTMEKSPKGGASALNSELGGFFVEDGSPEVPSAEGAAQHAPEGITAEDPQAKNPSFRPGATIAEKYVVERLVGEGGLGVVVAAKHLQLDQTVAIKYLRPRALGSKGVAERFLREARLAAKMRSEHVVHVYDVGTMPDGAPFMVMELLVGTDLGRQLTTSGPLTIERTIDYVLQACEALAEAHAAGIVHRDIKPDNLFVASTTGGKSVLKILDFGISKMSAKRSTSGELRDLTEAGDKFGTPVYMSPEQLLASGNVDARADVWAMGVVFFELLTGQLPFDGDSLPELCTAILNKAPMSLVQLRSNIPAVIQAVIERCLEKDPANRFQNVAELAQELAPFVQQTGQERIDHIVRIIRGGGETVRAATPVPGASLSPRANRDVSTLAEPGDRALTTASGVASWGGPTVVPPANETARTRRTRLIAIAASAVLALTVVTASLTGHRSHDSTTDGPAGVPAATGLSHVTEEPSPVPALVDVDPPAPPAAADDPAASASAANAHAPAAVAAHKASKGAPAKGKAPSHSSHADPNAVINPFE
jgi:serine/threonine protein kinase